MKVTRRSLLAASLAVPAHYALAEQVKSADWPSALLMATGRPGGAYEIYGPAWGKLAQQESGVAIAYRASGGAAADILLIEQGAAALGMTTVTVASQARTGRGDWTAGVKFESFRALFPMFPSILQIVTPAAGGIRTLAGLDDRNIGVGPDGGSGSAAVPALFREVGVIPRNLVTGDYQTQINAMLNGELAACAFIGAPPVPAIYAAAHGHQLGLIGFTEAEARQISKTIPGMAAMLLPAGTFPGQTQAISSVGTANFAIAAAALPDALVNAITLAAMQNRQILANIVPAAALPAAAMLGTAGDMTFHPGAATALRSLGMNLPAKLIEG